MHTTSVQTHIMEASGAGRKGQTTGPAEAKITKWPLNPSKCDHGKHLRAGGKDNALEMA